MEYKINVFTLRLTSVLLQCKIVVFRRLPRRVRGAAKECTFYFFRLFYSNWLSHSSLYTSTYTFGSDYLTELPVLAAQSKERSTCVTEVYLFSWNFVGRDRSSTSIPTFGDASEKKRHSEKHLRLARYATFCSRSGACVAHNTRNVSKMAHVCDRKEIIYWTGCSESPALMNVFLNC